MKAYFFRDYNFRKFCDICIIPGRLAIIKYNNNALKVSFSPELIDDLTSKVAGYYFSRPGEIRTKFIQSFDVCQLEEMVTESNPKILLKIRGLFDD